MRNFCVGVWGCLLLVFACSNQNEVAKEPEVWSESKVFNQLTDRWNQGDTLPALHNSLRAFFPDLWKPFIRNEISSSGIYEKSAFFSHAKNVYFQTDGTFLELYIADYSADRDGFIRLIQEFEKVKANESAFAKIWREEERGVFAWERLDQQSQLHYLEAGAYARYHILIRTNLPEANLNLSQVWQRLNWKRLKPLEVHH